jgi:glycosyltransferase involved in cell wall biosynthesis
VGHEQDGLLVPARDPGALAEALIRVLRDPGLAARLGAAGLAKARSFAWPRVTDQVEAYYRELVRQPRI